MLSIHVVHTDRWGYYLDDLVPGRPEATLVSGERPARWAGDGAAMLGLRGTVDADTFVMVMNGQDPRSGRSLRSPHGEASVSAYDLTFCAPKSVSLLHALAPTEIAAEVGAGHDAAVAETSAYLARRAVGVRRAQGQGTPPLPLPSTGMVAGEFLHRTSRALDPHLHTHVVAANVAQGVDGKWSAVDSRRVFAHLRAAGAVYQAALRSELSSRLGVAWEVRPSGLGDVVGVDNGLRRLFSQRAAAIEEYLMARGAPGQGVGHERRALPRRRSGAFFATRPDKDRTQVVESLMPEWRSRAADFGYDLGDLGQVVGRGRRTDIERGSGGSFDPRRLIDRLEELEPTGRHLARRDVVTLVAAASVGGATVPVIESVTDRLVAGKPSWPWDRSTEGGSAREPRWACQDLLRSVRGHQRELVAAVDGPDGHRRGDGAVSDRVAARRRGRADFTEPDRHSARSDDRRRGRGEDSGLGR